MAKIGPRVKQQLGDFVIVHPATDEPVALAADDTVAVEVDDSGNHDEFRAAVYGVCDANPPPPAACPDALTQGAGNTWRGKARVLFLDLFDILENHKHVVVWGRLGTDW